jgi:hypothetical protein
MTIVSSTEAVAMVHQQEVLSSKEEEGRESIPEVERRELAKSELDIEVPSSPLGASACTLEDPEKEKRMSSPGLPSDRKRKKANQLYPPSTPFLSLSIFSCLLSPTSMRSGFNR